MSLCQTSLVLNVIMLNIGMLSVVMLNVLAPYHSATTTGQWNITLSDINLSHHPMLYVYGLTGKIVTLFRPNLVPPSFPSSSFFAGLPYSTYSTLWSSSSSLFCLSWSKTGNQGQDHRDITVQSKHRAGKSVELLILQNLFESLAISLLYTNISNSNEMV